MHSSTDSDSPAPLSLDIYIDFVCPWCYLAHGVVEQLQLSHDLKVNWLPFPLHPDTPAEGLLLQDLFRGANVDSMHARLYSMMDELGLEYDPGRDRLFNTRKAQELLYWAKQEQAEAMLVKELFRAYFVDNRNLAEADVLLDVVDNCGLDRDAAAEALLENSCAAEVDSAWEQARSYQITGVPAFIGGGYQFSGYQPLPEMERFLSFISKQASPTD